MSTYNGAESLLTSRHEAALGMAKRRSRLLIHGVLAATLFCASEAKSQQPLGQAGPSTPQPQSAAEIDNASALDKLLADHDYTGLADKMLKRPDKALIVPNLNWAKARMLAGASQIVPLLYAQMLWGIASSNPQFADLKETAGAAIVYALLLTYADGAKCPDQTAPQHHFDTIMQRYTAELQFVAQMPNDRKDTLFRTVIAIEQQTALRRPNDNYLCRFGLQEMQDSLAKYPPTEVQEPPGPGKLYSKTMVTQYDPNYEPKFLPREQWEPKQAAQRARFATLLPTIVDRFKNVPAPQPLTPQAPSPKP